MFRGQPKPAPSPQTPPPPQTVGRFPGSLERDLRRWAIEQAIAARIHGPSSALLIDTATAIYHFASGLQAADPVIPSE